MSKNMHYLPIKTRIMQPPKDDLFTLCDEYLTKLHEGDILLITSKVVSIHQGRCIPLTEAPPKRTLVESEAEYLFDGQTKYANSPLAIKYGALFYGAGIDESNADGHYVLLPERPFETAQEIWTYLTKKHQIKKLGVIITDSHSLPLRRGCMSISIGLWGFHPIEHHAGKPDLFGRKLTISSTNIPDALSAGASLVTGEADECIPMTIARDVPNVRYATHDVRHEILIPPEDDIYYPLLKPVFESKK